MVKTNVKITEDMAIRDTEDMPICDEVGRGAIWWIADDQVEAEEWKRKFEANGASVEITQQADCPRLDVIIKMPIEQAAAVLGYEPELCEWLER